MPPVTLDITILQAQGLAGKDRSLLSFKKTSDPFVNIKVNERIVKRTSIKNKTVDPVWNESFTVTIEDDKTDDVVRLDILDHDVMTENDPMGSVVIFPNGNVNNGQTESTEWYEIPPDSAENACGKIQVRLGVTHGA